MLNSNKKIIGINITDNIIEVVEIGVDNGSVKILNVGKIKLESEIVKYGRIKNGEKLAKSLKKVLAEAKPTAITEKQAVFSLSENQTYVHTFKRKKEKNKKIKNIVLEEIKKTIPLEENNLIYNYKILSNLENKHTIILSIASNKKVVNEWQEFFKKVELDIKLFDIETLACFRGIFDKLPKNPICILNINTVVVNLSIFSSIGLSYSCSIKIVDSDFKKQLAEKIKENIDYWQEKNKQEIKKIILIGKSDRIKNLIEFLNSLNLVSKISLGKLKFKQSNINSEFEYIKATGTALRYIDDRWRKTDPVIIISKNKKYNKSSLINNITQKIVYYKKYIIYIFLIFIMLFIFIKFFTKNKTSEVILKTEQNKLKINKPEIDKLKIINNQAEEKINKSKINKIKIKQISQKLNVRSGSSINYRIIGKAESSAEYILLEENDGWFKIQLTENLVGWISINFAERIN